MLVFDSIWPTTVEGWVGLITLIFGLVGAIAALVPTAIKLYHSLKDIVKNKNWLKIMELADVAIQAAEKTHKEGKDKKEMVIESVKAGAKELGIEIDEKQLDDLSKYIDDAIDFFNGMKKAERKK